MRIMTPLLTTTSSPSFSVSKPATAVSTMHRLVANREYDIEFHGYLSNHAKHAVIALERLGAPATRIEAYWDAYTDTTPYGLSLHRATRDDGEDSTISPASSDEWYTLRGKKQRFWNMCHYLQDELHGTFDGNINAMVQSYAPDLLSGLPGALTHGIIHLGWSLDAYRNDNDDALTQDPNQNHQKNPWMVIEGLAYLNFSFLSVHPEQFQHAAIDEKSAMETWRRIARTWDTDHLQRSWIEPAKAKYDETSGFHSELVPAGFQWQLSKVLDQPHPIMTQLPTWLDTMGIPTLLEELYKMATILYLVTRDSQDGHGNFLILHLITSLWGLEHVLNVIQNDDIARSALKCYHVTMVGLLATSTGGIPSVDALDKIVVDQNLYTSVDTAQQAKMHETTEWSDKIRRAVYDEEEEHNIKLVYVTRALWRRYRHWTAFRVAAQAFTLTPDIGGSSGGGNGGTSSSSSTAFQA